LPTATMSSVPTIAGATPPPTSPGGSGRSVKKARFKADQPDITTFPTISVRTETAMAAETSIKPDARAFDKRRRSKLGDGARSAGVLTRRHVVSSSSVIELLSSPNRAGAWPARDAPHEQSREDVQHAGDEQEHQSDGDDGAEVDRFVCLGELVGDGAREGVAGGEQRRLDPRRAVADHHRDSHRLTQPSRQAEDQRAGNPAAGV